MVNIMEQEIFDIEKLNADFEAQQRIRNTQELIAKWDAVGVPVPVIAHCFKFSEKTVEAIIAKHESKIRVIAPLREKPTPEGEDIKSRFERGDDAYQILSDNEINFGVVRSIINNGVTKHYRKRMCTVALCIQMRRDGKSTMEIAQNLGIGENTVKYYIAKYLA